MDKNGVVSFKIYLIRKDSPEPEIRRFGLQESAVTNYSLFISRVTEIFPKLSDNVFRVYWKDEDGDEIAISSDEELIIALTSLKSDVKTFYIKAQSIQSPTNEPRECESPFVHRGVYCDGCSCNITGFRYKCMVCKDYDLCSACESAGIHPEHPVLRISSQFSFDRMKIRKLAHVINSLSPVFIEMDRSRKHHSHEHSDYGKKKKKRCGKRESDSETADESEESCHKKYNLKKCKKFDKCGYGKARNVRSERRREFRDRFSRAGPYTEIMNSFLSFFNPVQFHPKPSCDRGCDGADKSQEEDPCQSSYLRSVGYSLQKLLDPLGVNVEFEVRPRGEKREEKKGEGKKEEQKNEKQEPEITPSAPIQKEVRFEASETMKEKVDEITKILANQTMSRSQSADNEGWVSFEELKRDSESRRRLSDGTVQEMIDLEGNSSESNKKEQEIPSVSRESRTLYPNLTPSASSPSNSKVRASLEKMLAMGFTNEGNWLTSLLNAKDGDINQVLEVLAFGKRD